LFPHNTHTFILKTTPQDITCKHVFIHKYREQPSKNKLPTLAKSLEEHRNKTIEEAPSKHNKHSAIKNNTLKTNTPLSPHSPI
jgi:hypothetical protein